MEEKEMKKNWKEKKREKNRESLSFILMARGMSSLSRSWVQMLPEEKK